MMSKIILPSVVSLTVLLTGCMSGWNRSVQDPSSLNSYLNQQAVSSKPAAKHSTMPETEKPKQHELARSESSDVAFGKKLAARMAELEQQQATAAPESKTYVARVEALSLPIEDKKQILSEFASASDAQWEELLSKLEPVFGPKPQAVVKKEDTSKADMLDQYANNLVQRHLKTPDASDAANEQPKRLPSPNMNEDTSHLAQVDPSGYPRTIDLDRGKTSPEALATAPPQEKIRRDTGVQLAAYVPEMDAHSEGLYPEDVQAAAIADMKRNPQNLPDKTAGPKPKAVPLSQEEEAVSQLTRVEYRAMQILWQRSQLSLEALYKEYKAQFASEQSKTSPDPSILSLDEMHAILFDLKGRGWVADTRRGNTVVYWAARNQEESDAGSWEKLIDDTIQKLERVATDTRASEEERTIAQLRLRMLYLIANRKSDAMEKVDGLTSEEQEVWSNTLFGLADYMKVEDIPVERRHTLALGSFRRAMSHLEAASPLELRNLEFIQSVDSFGQFKPFPSHDFQPKQEVLLYVEIENFTSRDNGGKFETTLQSNYEIYDQSGRRIDARQFPEVKDSCRVRRRDFYVPYRLYMPENIPAGTYRLELTVRDSAADKFGQASIEFQIK
ncbi:hypothetical protein C5Y96_00820 [Blastopirellula marina]|uniref:Uncharacterized protein n=1 Tax=Blastopirellula marina TaxID=124 RepID=A0A2S8G9Z1_9BACT|nr:MULTISPECIES: hypothetical protein [Pirellulaceae]PQO41285.1 hypothetical protein C5Y96_00820 [Blastopirellula marina]RCS56309.1 hypothetical protein DTL36_00820 [Bremerella cremea]